VKQLSFFAQKNKSDLVDCNDPKIWKLYTDGASRNNPGPSGIGFCLKNGDKTVCEQGFYIGKKTNNQAEYTALLVGIFFAQEFVKPSDTLAIYSDSQLLIRQMNGQYRVKDGQLKKLQEIAYNLLKGYKFTFCHIYRDQNTRADELANRGLDKKVFLPKKVADMLSV
tara:strand:+ start:850 stop:1350 length:501 start_codon:yes stop_codon:yes gene_type:complete